MRPIIIGIGHDDDLRIVAFGIVKITAQTCPDRMGQGIELKVLGNVVQGTLLRIQYLSTQRQNGLEMGVSSLLRRAACRITLDQEQFLDPRIAGIGRRQLSGQQLLCLGGLGTLADFFPRLTGSLPGLGSLHHFADQRVGQFAVFFKPEGKLV